ncbi:hypothetical protein niasHT_019573 [Heterodera trifolii]|uniref:Uncharacterized protein n=1 Tax=Heterodera trifolii TaxID=157864 RepID=A0ABD2L878_9BILA
MGNKGKKNRRMWSGIKPGDENFTPIPASIGLSEDQRKWEDLSFWQRAENSEYFQREGKERWLRACLLLNSQEDFRIAYKIGPPDLYTDEALGNLDTRQRRATLDSLKKMHPGIQFPEPLQNFSPEPLDLMYGLVMLKDLSLEQLLLYVQPGSYFYPDSPTDEINEMVQQFKWEEKEGRRYNWTDSNSMPFADWEVGAKLPKTTKTPPAQPSPIFAESQKDKFVKKQVEKEKPTGENERKMTTMAPEGAPDDTPSGFGGILRQKAAAKPKKNVRWSTLMMMSDGNKVQLVASGFQMVDNESVRMAMDAPLDDDGWEDL